MAQTVADVLVGVLERVGVRQIFGLIGDSLNPLADSVRHSSIEWTGVRHEGGAALAPQAKPSSLGVLRSAPGPPGRAATIWSRASTRRHTITLPCSQSPATCR